MENKIMAELKFGCLFNFFGAMKWTYKISDHAKKNKIDMETTGNVHAYCWFKRTS